MTFIIRVREGAQSGQEARVEGLTIVGRSPRSNLQIPESEVSWEHVAFEDRAGRLFLSRLSAGEVRVNGQKVSGEVRLSARDVVQLGSELELGVIETIGATRRRGIHPGILAAAILGLIGVGVFFVLSIGDPPPPRQKFGFDDAHFAYKRLDRELEAWVEQGRYPEEAHAIFRDAWRYEIADNPMEAFDRYKLLSALLLSTKNPAPGLEERVLAEVRPGPPTVLTNLLKRQANALKTDRDAAEAYYWFIKARTSHTRNAIQ